MDIIQLLPDSVANQIAAGEVIQRPASVIKELMENAVDAGAKTIKVLVVEAGRTSIQVVDDGRGMSDTDARLSFERHATSKIRKADDLFSLHTMGFRGEALASIAAVAQVTLQTRMASDDIGTRLVLSGSKILEQEPVSCPVGSNFLIENLFFNIPVRRKFLKSNATEMSNIMQAFENIVLVYPEISFMLYHNGQEVMNLRSGNLRQRVVDVFGKRMNQDLLPINTDTSLCKISGFIGKPEAAKKKGAKQFFFVNGRYMKHPYFHKAVMMAFERLVPAGEQIPYFIYLEVDPADIDVNIHPVKTEIKFDNEQAIWQIIMASARDAVGKYSGVTAIDFDVEGMPDIPVFNPNDQSSVNAPRVDIDPTYNPFHSPSNGGGGGQSFAKSPMPNHGNNDWQALYGKIEEAKSLQSDGGDESELFPSSLFESDENESALAGMSADMYQYNASYIIAQSNGNLVMIDQHRAHVRILFEDYMRRLSNRVANTQKLLFPGIVQFPPSYSDKLEPVLENLQSLGFEISNLGGNNYSVSGIPGGLSGLDAVTLVNELVAAAIDHGNDLKEEVNGVLALELAYRAATPYGEILSHERLDKLVKMLMECETQNYTPDGKTIISVFSQQEIEKRFG